MKHHEFCFVDEILAMANVVVSLTESLCSVGLRRWRNDKDRKKERAPCEFDCFGENL